MTHEIEEIAAFCRSVLLMAADGIYIESSAIAEKPAGPRRFKRIVAGMQINDA